jgi:hypothetical protein
MTVSLFLMLCAAGWGATYYVDKSAADDTGDGTIGSPKKLVNSGILLAIADGDIINISADAYTGSGEFGTVAYPRILTTQDDVDFTIQPWTGQGAGDLVMTGATFDMYIAGDGGTVTLQDFTLTGTSLGVYNADGSTKGLILDNMTMGLAAKTGRALFLGSADGVLTERAVMVQNGCTLLGSIHNTTSSNLTVENSTINTASNSYNAIHFGAGIGDVLIDTVDITASGSKGGIVFVDIAYTKTHIGGTIRIKDSTINRAQSYGIKFSGCQTDVIEIINTTIHASGATGVGTAIAIGEDYHDVFWGVGGEYKDGTGDTPAYPSRVIHANRFFRCKVDHTAAQDDYEPGIGASWEDNWYEYLPIQFVRVIGCTVTNDTDGQAHTLLIGSPVRGAEIAYNNFEGGDFGMQIKGHACHVHNNISTSPHAIRPVGGQNCIVNNNVAKSMEASPAIAVGDSSGIDGDGTIIRNNIILNTSTGPCLSVPAEAGDVYCDYNLYYNSGTGPLAIIYGTDCDTLAEIQAAWIAAGYPDNDQHSVVRNPGTSNTVVISDVVYGIASTSSGSGSRGLNRTN